MRGKMSRATTKLAEKGKQPEIIWNNYISGQEMSFHSVEKLNDF
jgi:hypothetical protein